MSSAKSEAVDRSAAVAGAAPASELLVFDMTSEKAAKNMADRTGKPPAGKHDRPWRKSAAAIKAERESLQRSLVREATRPVVSAWRRCAL